jgi:sulfur carrier protein ThiS
MLTLKMTALLAKRAKSKVQEVQHEYTPGMTVADLVGAEGFEGHDAEAIQAIVNGTQQPREYQLNDGDTVELLVGIAGG